MRWAGHVARTEEDKRVLPNFNRKENFRRRLRCRREDNIRMDLIKIDVNTRNWVDSAQDRDYWRALVNAASNLRVP